MSNPFRLALVGAGMITQQSHLPAALASNAVEVTAIVDPVVERATGLAKSYGIDPRIVGRVEDILADVDGAIIATPNDSHRAIAVTCLKAGVSTLIEKPLANNYQAGLEIVRAAEESAKVVAVGYSTRFRHSISLLKTLLDEQYFGGVRGFVHQFGTQGGWAPLSSYNLTRNAAGGGVLMVTGTHFLDRMLHFWGYPEEALLQEDSAGGPEANCTATFTYPSLPGKGVARYSKTVRLPGGMVIETDNGYVVLIDNDDAEIVFREHSKPHVEQIIRGTSRLDGNPVASVFQQQLENFIQACRGGEPPRVDGRQGLESLRLIEQLYSNKQEQNVNYYPQVERRIAN